jgi:hypothetical protein
LTSHVTQRAAETAAWTFWAAGSSCGPATWTAAAASNRDVLGLAIYREFGPPDDPGVMFFLGPGLPGISGHTVGPPGHSVMIWIQARDIHAGHARLAAGAVPIVRGPATGPWGLTEMWIQDPRWHPDRLSRGSRQ